MKREYTVNLALAYAKRFLKKYGRGSESLEGMCNHVRYLYNIREDEIEDFKTSLIKWNEKQPISYFIFIG